MDRIMTAGDLGIRAATAAASAASGLASYAMGDWSMQVVGVPLPTMLAAFAGAMISLTFLSVATIARAASIVAAGTLAGAYTAPLTSHLFGLPDGVEKGVAFLLGGALQVVIPAGMDWVKRKLGS